MVLCGISESAQNTRIPALCFSTKFRILFPYGESHENPEIEIEGKSKILKIGNQRGRAPKAPAPFGGGQRPPHQFFNIEDCSFDFDFWVHMGFATGEEDSEFVETHTKSEGILAFWALSEIPQSTIFADFGDF